MCKSKTNTKKSKLNLHINLRSIEDIHKSRMASAYWLLYQLNQFISRQFDIVLVLGFGAGPSFSKLLWIARKPTFQKSTIPLDISIFTSLTRKQQADKVILRCLIQVICGRHPAAGSSNCKAKACKDLPRSLTVSCTNQIWPWHKYKLCSTYHPTFRPNLKFETPKQPLSAPLFHYFASIHPQSLKSQSLTKSIKLKRRKTFINSKTILAHLVIFSWLWFCA